jgi:hypothetical protein
MSRRGGCIHSTFPIQKALEPAGSCALATTAAAVGDAAQTLLGLTGRSSHPMHAALVDRIRGEFIEMPGLQLTMAQAAKLWGMDLAACKHVVDVLVAASFLRWTRGGKIARIEHA